MKSFLIFLLAIAIAECGVIYTKKCHCSCGSCSKQSSVSGCVTCRDKTAIYKAGKCICPKFSQAIGLTGFCESCHFTCSKCSSPHDPTACLACDCSAKLVNGRCICPQGQGMTAKGKCKPCYNSCRTCSLANNKDFCTSCKDTLATVVKVPKVCTLCFPPPPECDNFTSLAGRCDCPAGYAYDAKGMCQPCALTCLNCSAPANASKCTACKPGAFLNASGVCECLNEVMDVNGNCVMQCDPSCSNCTVSNNPNFCTVCTDTTAIFTPIPVGSNTGTCTCKPGSAMLPTGTCQPCAGICLTCSSPLNISACTTCRTGAFVNTTTGMCQCTAGVMDQNGNCVLVCDPSCSTCVASHNASQCTSCTAVNATLVDGPIPGVGTCVCPDGTFFDPTVSNCVPCPLGCSTCTNATTCTSCSTGYYPDPTSGLCPNCMLVMSNCTACTNATFCTDCLPGNQAINGICVPTTLPQPCPAGQFLGPNGVCETCPGANCTSCDSTGTCLACAQGSALNSSGICVPCHSHCLRCEFSLTSTNLYCLDCDDNYVPRGADCICCSKAIPNCLQCSNTGCLICNKGYYKVNDNTCAPCSKSIPHCSQCSSAKVCAKCDLPYSLNAITRQCENIKVPYCKECGNGKCSKCKKRYYSDATKKCGTCHSSCGRCSGPKNTHCTTCPLNSIFSKLKKGKTGSCKCKQGHTYDAKLKYCVKHG